MPASKHNQELFWWNLNAGIKPGEVYAFDCCRSWLEANSPPWQRRGGRAIKKYPRSFERRGRGGSFKLHKTISLERTTPSALIRWLRDNFFRGAATPSLPRASTYFSHCLPNISNPQ